MNAAEKPLSLSPAPLIDVEELEVRYGTRAALRGLSFTVKAGEVVGLLGPNGAGKTTTFSVLATLRKPDAGRVTVAGLSVADAPKQVRRMLGVVPQSLALYPTFSARENVVLFARLAGLRGRAVHVAATAALQLVGLEDRADDRVGSFSGGMQHRLNLACGILHAPRVVLLDEPTVGVDPQSRERIGEAVRDQARRGAAVLYSTHDLDEAERVCDRVVLIDEGHVVSDGTPEELIRRSGGVLRLEVVTRAPLPVGWFEGVDGVVPIHAAAVAPLLSRGPTVHVGLTDLSSASRVLERATACGGGVLEFHVHQPSLQDVFMALTGRALRD